MFRNTKGFRAPAAAALAFVFAACAGDYSGGYEKVPFRETPGLMLAAAPDPPPVIAGFGGAGAAAPVLTPENTPPGVTQEMVENGMQLFGTVCTACHGVGGGGTAAGPQLSDASWIHISGSFDEIVNIIQTGVPTPRDFAAPMPPMGGGSFNADQVRAIAAYIYALSVQDGA
jgi:cytochrome c oxidase cbb3-type subunit 3